MKKLLAFITLTALLMGCSKNGVEQTYFDNGQLESETSYKDGKKISLKHWRTDGKPSSETIYKEDGEYETVWGWWSNDQLMDSVIYKDGKRLYSKDWDKDGQLHEENYYMNEMLKELKYKNDTLFKVTCYNKETMTEIDCD
jgi:antitoxin component YwqK of YwqJK toxin-antitoxin module